MLTIRNKRKPWVRRTRLAQFSLGDEAIDKLIRIAKKHKVSRSEMLRDMIARQYQEDFHGK